MRFVAGLIATLPLLASPTVVQASDCSGAETQADMNACAAQELAAAEVELEVALRTLQRSQAEIKRAPLDRAQGAWTSYRDAQCAFEGASVEGGSLQPMVVSFCLAELTRARTEQLGRLGSCEEGDVACVGR